MLVSVLMPVYNDFRFVKEAIDSILSQTHTDIEFIIIDDGSTEPIWDLLQTYRDTRMILLQNDRRMGLTHSINRGLEVAKGDFIARQDSDDISLPERLEKSLSVFKSHPGIGLVSTWGHCINEDGHKVGVHWYEKIKRLSDKQIKRMMLDLRKKNHILGAAAIYPRRVVDKIGYFDPEVYYAQDCNYWVRILQFFDVKILHEETYIVRINPKSLNRSDTSDRSKVNHVLFAKQRALKYPIIKDWKRFEGTP